MVNLNKYNKRKYRCVSQYAPCLVCNVIIEGGDARKLIEHYVLEHGRVPTDGEIHQFRNYRRKDFSAKKYPDHFKKSFKEVSGGLPSLGKKR